MKSARRGARVAGGIVFAGALAMVAGATPADAQVYSGKATRVGDAPAVGEEGNSIVSVNARFTAAVNVDLSTTKLIVTNVLSESGAGGAGELVKGTGGVALVPVTLVPRAGNRDTSGVFLNPSTLRPSLRATVRRRDDGTYQLNLKVNRATIASEPALCSADDPSVTTLTTKVSFGDGVNPPVLTQTFDTSWICDLGADRLRVAPPAPAPTPVPGVPVAEIRVDQITRETGQPNLVRLDGSRSSDADGTIASYTFSVIDLANGSVVFGPTTIATATVDTTLPPGDYRATLSVKDNDSKVSPTATRGFTLH